MLRRSAPPAADIAVSVDPKPLYPGDAVHVEIVVTPRSSFTAAAGLLRLSQTEVLRIDSARDAVPQMMMSGRGRRRRFGDPEHIDHVFCEDAAFEGGVPQTYHARLRLPVPAAPTVKGKYAQITWQLSASILTRADWMPNMDGLFANLATGRAGENSQEVVVFAHPEARHIGGEALPDQPANKKDYRNLSLDLSLESGLAVNGGAVAGSLSVSSHAAVKGRELRVELVRWERSGNKQARIVESLEVLQRPAIQDAGEQTDWAFRLPVPDRLMPSVLGQHTFVGWQVRAVIARRLLPNYSVSQIVQVYTSPRI